MGRLFFVLNFTLRHKLRRVSFLLRMLLVAFFSFASSLYALEVPLPQNVEATQFQIAKERADATANLQPKQTEVRTRLQGDSILSTIPVGESPCFEISQISLEGEGSKDFDIYLHQALHSLKYSPNGMCIGIGGIQTILRKIQNNIITAGYVTTRVLAQPQDLTTKKLVYTLLVGKADDIKSPKHPDALFTKGAIPIQNHDALNLRDIEQGLENLRRLPTATAAINIIPSQKTSYSDLVVQYDQKKLPIRTTFSLDNAGSKATGKIQGGITVAWDNPLGLNDIFYFGYTTNVRSAQVARLNGVSQVGGSQNRTIHYSIPWGYWLVSFNENSYDYEQKVVGATEIYTYSGTSSSRDISIRNVLYRDDTTKFSATLKGWERYSDSYINDAEITVQRRKTAGYEIGIDWREYFGSTPLDTALYYKRGTGARGALRAPEELFDEGTSRARLFTASTSLYHPFNIDTRHFAYQGSLRGQYALTKLTPQDRFAIGSQYTVRGFDGEYILSGENGIIFRNDVEWQYSTTHKIYLALDAAEVGGASSKNLIGQKLIGSAVGVRGQWSKSGVLSYDLFVGVPLYVPQNFPKENVTSGFSVNLSF